MSAELLCSFELLKPLDSSALKNHIKKGRNKRNSMLNSPVSLPFFLSCFFVFCFVLFCFFLFAPLTSLIDYSPLLFLHKVISLNGNSSNLFLSDWQRLALPDFKRQPHHCL